MSTKQQLELGKQYSIYDLERANDNAGMFWFSPSTKRFFSSRIAQDVLVVADGWLFISSERGPHQNSRSFSIRHMNQFADVRTVGEFQQYDTKSRALSAARKLAKSGQTIVASYY